MLLDHTPQRASTPSPLLPSSLMAPSITILTGNGGLFLDFELERGADGALGENIVTKLPLPDQNQQEILAALDVHLPAM